MGMTKETIVFCIGALVFLSPYLGIPGSYKKWFLVIAGILLMAIGYRLRRNVFLRSLEGERGERKSDAFVESNVNTQGEHIGRAI